MSDLRDLYQQVIMDHKKNPRNFREITDANHMAHGNNPLCGDALVVYVKLNGEIIEDVSFQGSGCAISVASASLMTETLKGKTLEEAQTLYDNVHRALTGEEEGGELAGKLEVLGGVKEFPARVKCATLSWHTVHAAVDNDHDISITTE
ncbi:putative iron-sulfur cluster assembly scaffold protein for SUF system, SufE2 [Methylophaga thiooxydans]|uniref:SUF system FeS assembly protein, NifU family n=2 Tax=Methylophaga thiooxydans TaxID=392484 RepID=C0N7U2_9GAMM|nr:SUF system NifU family Fe-S cluster assembly protein [Methylophaga thiooxydans]EEF79146.1 SUF system FeS assembly protein, NifU family [Methylophaga thiooxydans DMS010]KGM07010.1 putative iron-sulfur cluster assembly scaffold protein for SUF system, SufE2 [Methylophaga thiooxydans]|mmetsp:Transcript_8154/g.10576  ORF Transcript_8154/g.10576 Transcript_8154/m.10576 type:complete len:149 (-) Transcript_8154:674-1120(-)